MQGRARRLAAAGVTVALAAAGAAIPSASGADSAQELRRQSRALEARSGSALLELYALESALARANAELAAAQGRAEAVAAEQAQVGKRLAVAKQTLAAAQAALAERLRDLYQLGETSPLEILLGARSVDEALAGIDGLRFAAGHDRQIVEQTRAARVGFAALAEELETKRAQLAQLVEARGAQAAALEQRRAARVAFIAELERAQRLTAAQIRRLESRARAARAKAQTMIASPVAPSRAAAPAPPEATPEPAAAPVPQVEAGRTLTVTATGYALRGRTATGIPTGPGVVAVDPSVIPLGTKLVIPGYGTGVAADTGGSIRGAKIDIWFPTRAQALAWGVRTVTITIQS